LLIGKDPLSLVSDVEIKVRMSAKVFFEFGCRKYQIRKNNCILLTWFFKTGVFLQRQSEKSVNVGNKGLNTN